MSRSKETVVILYKTFTIIFPWFHI